MAYSASDYYRGQPTARKGTNDLLAYGRLLLRAPGGGNDEDDDDFGDDRGHNPPLRSKTRGKHLGTCYHCNRLGHHWSMCWNLCNICGTYNHSASRDGRVPAGMCPERLRELPNFYRNRRHNPSDTPLAAEAQQDRVDRNGPQFQSLLNQNEQLQRQNAAYGQQIQVLQRLAFPGRTVDQAIEEEEALLQESSEREESDQDMDELDTAQTQQERPGQEGFRIRGRAQPNNTYGRAGSLVHV